MQSKLRGAFSGFRVASVAIVGGLLVACGAAAGEPSPHQALGVRFETPVEFSEPESIGMDAVVLMHPPGEREIACEIVICRLPRGMVEGMEGDQEQLMMYFKSTFLGTSKPAEGTRERTILGQVSAGQTLATSIPRTGRVEVHLVALSDGARLGVAVRTFGDTPAELGEQVMAALATSLAEVEEPE